MGTTRIVSTTIGREGRGEGCACVVAAFFLG
jgi:hypothetical protein